jgi:hypothetical protein
MAIEVCFGMFPTMTMENHHVPATLRVMALCSRRNRTRKKMMMMMMMKKKTKQFVHMILMHQVVGCLQTSWSQMKSTRVAGFCGFQN